MPQYSQDQSVNKYVDMLHNIFGPTQNYAKSKYEILSHLSEVVGITGKYILRKHDPQTAAKFMPKIFGWACALLKSVSPSEQDLEAIILRKFPRVCPYCLRQPCECWNKEKPNLEHKAVNRLYLENSSSQRRSVDEMELMFKNIYNDAWCDGGDPKSSLVRIYMRFIEEFSEVAEAVRFYHLYPDNFENELADFMAWWFALSVTLRWAGASQGASTSAQLWKAYPGQCQYCESAPCFCQQGPVRELMSRPTPGQYHEVDHLTSLRNQNSYLRDIGEVESNSLSFTFPIACVRCDVDNFKEINNRYGHPAGDVALKHIASTIRAKVGPRHRVYRISGDEFGILMPDTSGDEAAGLMGRVLLNLRNTSAEWTSPAGKTEKFSISLSVGVAECHEADKLEATFNSADQAALASKSAGKGRVTKYVSEGLTEPAASDSGA